LSSLLPQRNDSRGNRLDRGQAHDHAAQKNEGSVGRRHGESRQSSMMAGMSQRATLVILFWTYFETRINRIVSFGAKSLPEAVSLDLLRRYDSVTSHTRQLYRILFGTTYREDLIAVGAESVDGHLARVQEARNRFVHGHPSAISDELVEAVVRNLEAEHEAWVKVLNRRVQLAKVS
jgi:hypothetical protein